MPLFCGALSLDFLWCNSSKAFYLTLLSGEGLEPTVDFVSSTRAVSVFAYKATGK